MPLPELSPYTYGTMSLGKSEATLEADIRLARRAMDAGIWFHSSPTYNRGFTFLVLRMAFDQARRATPKLIVKIRDGMPWLLRFEVEDTLRRLAIERIDIAQLTHMNAGPGGVVDDFARQGETWQTCEALRREGKVGSFVLVSNSRESSAVRRALNERILDGVIFYFNLRERNVDDATFAELQQRQTPVLALRTLAGGVPQLHAAADAELLAMMRETGLSWVELNLRYVWSHPQVRTSIGGTANPAHFEEYLRAAEVRRPLPAALVARIDKLLIDSAQPG